MGVVVTLISRLITDYSFKILSLTKKPLTLCEQSEAGRLGADIELGVKALRRDYGVLQPSSNGDGLPSKV